MAALVITAASVIPVAGYASKDGIAGASISVGQVCYLDATTDTWKLADANDTVATAAAGGIALNIATAGQPVRIWTGGSCGFGAIFTAGVVYYLSPTAGGICAVADLSGSRVVVLGYASTTANLVLGIINTGVTLA